VRSPLCQVIGREREVARIMQILGRRTKNNPILLGEPGGLRGGHESAQTV
jgi:ATP-dependent Clp protease ATP-binding subunit ClpA